MRHGSDWGDAPSTAESARWRPTGSYQSVVLSSDVAMVVSARGEMSVSVTQLANLRERYRRIEATRKTNGERILSHYGGEIPAATYVLISKNHVLGPEARL